MTDTKMSELDLINRDPHDMNNYIQVNFDDVLGEPEGAHAAECVWQNAFKCFNCGKNFCYKYTWINILLFIIESFKIEFTIFF